MLPASPELIQAIISSGVLLLALGALLLRFGAWRRGLAVALGVCLLDQAAKVLVLRYLVYGAVPFRKLSLLKGWLVIQYQPNDGLGFGSSPTYLLVASLGLVGFLLVLYRRLALRKYRMPPLTETALALIVGGLLGILLDRVRLHTVIDFLEFGRYGNYTYNFADLAVFAAVPLLVIRWGQMLFWHSWRKGRR